MYFSIAFIMKLFVLILLFLVLQLL